MNNTISDKITTILKELFPEGANLHEPSFDGNEKEYLCDCINSTFVSSVGKYVDKFEDLLIQYTGSKYAIAVTNGTAAVHLCLIVCGVKRNDEVLIPALNFIAAANAISYCGAVPHFIDSSFETLGVCPNKLSDYLKLISEKKEDGFTYNKNTGRRIKACVPMHTFGHAVDVENLMDLCSRYNITMIEDAAESIGSFYKGQHLGNFGLVSALSFNGNKTITCGGGGAVLTNNKSIAALAKHISSTAKITHSWKCYHDMTGYNYRMPNLNAALGCAQIEQIDILIKQKRELANFYSNLFKNNDDVIFFTEPENSKSNYWLNAIILNIEDINLRNLVLDKSKNTNIMIRPVWDLLNSLPMYKHSPSMDLSVAESLEKRLICLPSSSFLINKINASY